MKYLLVGTLVLLAASCATRPSSLTQAAREEIEAPAAWSAEVDDDPVIEDWLQQFQSAELDELANLAVENNLSFQAGVQRTRAAEAAARINRATRLPGLNLGLNSGKQQTRFAGFNFQKIETDVHSLSLNSQWEVDVWGRVANSANAAELQSEAALEDLNAARLSLVGLVAKSYFNTIAAKKQQELASRNVQLLKQRFSTVKGRFDRGVADSSEYRAAEALLSSAEAALASRKIQYSNAVRTLETLLGDYPVGNLELAHELPSLASDVPAGLPAQLLSRRPDLRAEERRLAAQILSNRATQRNWLPRIALTGSYGTTSNELSDILDTDFDVWSLFGDLSAPLFNGGRLAAEREQATALTEAAVLEYKDAVLTAFREVESTLTAETLLKQLLNQQQQAADSFSLSEQRIESLYDRGTADLFTLIEARTRTLDAQIQLIDTQNRKLQNRVDLFIALGGSYNSNFSLNK